MAPPASRRRFGRLLRVVMPRASGAAATRFDPSDDEPPAVGAAAGSVAGAAATGAAARRPTSDEEPPAVGAAAGAGVGAAPPPSLASASTFRDVPGPSADRG